MAERPPRLCEHFGCTTLTKTLYCVEHQKDYHYRDPRPVERIRGYELQDLRMRIFKRDGWLCVVCRGRGRTRKAEELDHIVPLGDGGTDLDSNLQSLCIPCHKDKTRRERLAKAEALEAGDGIGQGLESGPVKRFKNPTIA